MYFLLTAQTNCKFCIMNILQCLALFYVPCCFENKYGSNRQHGKGLFVCVASHQCNAPSLSLSVTSTFVWSRYTRTVRMVFINRSIPTKLDHLVLTRVDNQGSPCCITKGLCTDCVSLSVSIFFQLFAMRKDYHRIT